MGRDKYCPVSLLLSAPAGTAFPPAEPDRFNHLPGQAWAITELIVTRYSGERPLFAAMRMRRALSLIKPSASFWL